MESSGEPPRRSTARDFDRDLDVDLDFDPFSDHGTEEDSGPPPGPPTLEEQRERLSLEQAPQRPRPRRRREPASRRLQRLARAGRGTRGGRRTERPRRRPGSETVSRVRWAIPLVFFAVTIIVVGEELFAAAMVGLACIGMHELFRMGQNARPFRAAAFITATAMVIAAYYGDQFQILLALAASFPLMLAFAAARGSLERITGAFAVTTFGIVWIGIPFAHAVLLRDLPDHGAALLTDVLVATFVADTAAYAGGRLFGRHQLAPALSPNKTIEGLAFGLLGGTLGFWFAGLYQDWLPGLDALLMGMCIAILAPLGDLFESAIKRDLGAKDSGNVFGPHGGLLDRLDAVLFTIVAGYYLSVLFVY
jgi:phosphatidate cytidylyltransferase